jgi:hypothetical protein
MLLRLLGAVLCIGGTWIISDGCYSILLYLNKPSYRGEEKQTWGKDHWIRCLRILWGLVFIGIGLVLIVKGG